MESSAREYPVPSGSGASGASTPFILGAPEGRNPASLNRLVAHGLPNPSPLEVYRSSALACLDLSQADIHKQRFRVGAPFKSGARKSSFVRSLLGFARDSWRTTDGARVRLAYLSALSHASPCHRHLSRPRRPDGLPDPAGYVIVAFIAGMLFGLGLALWLMSWALSARPAGVEENTPRSGGDSPFASQRATRSTRAMRLGRGRADGDKPSGLVPDR